MCSVTQSASSGIRATNSPYSFHTKSGKLTSLGSNEPPRDAECKAVAGERAIELKSCSCFCLLFN